MLALTSWGLWSEHRLLPHVGRRVFHETVYLLANAKPSITMRFSAFFSSAALVKLKEPVMTTCPSITITLLWAMAWEESMKVVMPA